MKRFPPTALPLIAPQLPEAYRTLPVATPFEANGVRLDIPVTISKGAELALVYGYPDLQAFCESIPRQSTVLDVGAGASTLGQEVCVERPDVRWTNIDPAYEDKTVRRNLSRQAPPNLKFVAGDVLALQEATNGRQYRLVLARRLVHHLRIAGSDVALEGLRELVNAGRPEDGTIAVGPVKRSMHDKNRPGCDAVTVPAPSSKAEAEETAQFLLSATTLSFWTRFRQARIDGKRHYLPV